MSNQRILILKMSLGEKVGGVRRRRRMIEDMK
jgi:hypothetical protein